MYKFSLIIPTYNISKFSNRFLQSLECIKEDVFVIFVDDCSGDDTKTLIKEFIKGKENMILAEHKINKGVAEALNTALNYIKTKWYFRVDSDDIILPNFYKEIISAIDKNPDAKLIRYKFLFRYEGERKVSKPNIFERMYFKMAFGWSCGINVEKFGLPYFKPGMKMEDFEMFGRQYSKSKDKEIFINKYLVEYTKNREDSIMNTISLEVLQNWKEAYKVYDNNKDLKSWRNKMYKHLLKRRIKKHENNNKLISK